MDTKSVTILIKSSQRGCWDCYYGNHVQDSGDLRVVCVTVSHTQTAITTIILSVSEFNGSLKTDKLHSSM